MPQDRDVLVIGAGIVGTCCALWLQREGLAVRLMDPGAPGEGASLGNAGNLGVASCVPGAMPGIWKRAARMLFDPLAPLKLRPENLARGLPWFLRFALNARKSRVEAIADARAVLLDRVYEGFDPLLKDAGAEDLIKRDGLLMTWESEEAFADSGYSLDVRRRRGVRFDVLDGGQARQIEPALSHSVARAIYLPDVSHTVNPLRLTQTLARHFERRGGTIIREAAKDFEFGPAGPRAVVTDKGRHAAGRFVVAAGVWSRELAARLGTRVPLVAERGYHTMFRNPGIEVRVPVMSVDRYIAVAPMEEGVRATGVAEFAAADAPARMAHADAVKRHAMGLFPRLRDAGATQWMGPRPAHPDSLPALGRAPRHANAWFAFGHDHIGLTLAGITGKLIGELVAGRTPSVDLAPYRPDRF